MPYACIHVPNFPVAAVLRSEPELQVQPVAVLEGKPPLEKVLGVNEKAASIGISAGMTKAQAELCTELALRPRSALLESSAHAALLDCAQSFSPLVEDAACDTALLDLAGMESLLGSLSKIARAIYDRALTLGLQTNVAVSGNPDASLLAARGLSSLTVIRAGEEADRLGPLPTEVLFADRLENEEKKEAERFLETLNRWGIRNLRALAALPQVALSERLGQKGLHLQQLARGAVQRTLAPVEEPMLFQEAMELEHAVILLEPLAFLLNRLLEQICARLASRALSTQEIRLTLQLENRSGLDQEFEDFGIPSESDATADKFQSGSKYFVSNRSEIFHRTLTLPLPMLDAKLFLKLLQLDLNANPPGAPIVKIKLEAEPARSRSAQGGLFLPPSPEPEKLELTLARIAAMVGENRVGALELLDTHRPEGFRMRRFVSELAGNEAQVKTQTEKEEKSAVTALRRFRPALRVTVSLEDGQPVRLICPKKKEVQGEILWKAGPWRASGDWWEKEIWSRDEWDIALQNKSNIALYRLVHDLMESKWFVEGTYD